MPIRLSGMHSGLDTEALVTELVSAYKKKGETYKKDQTKLSWKQDAWKALNTKVYNLFKKAGDLRFTSAYTTKKTTVSDATKASVTASNSSVNGTQTLEISKLAKGGYLTGAKLSSAGSGSAKISDLLSGTGNSMSGNGTYRISGNGVTKDITVNENTTINDFVSQLNGSGTGIKASYDTTNKRLFITSEKTGADADFTLTALDSDGDTALTALGVNTASKTSSAAAAAWLSNARYNPDGTLDVAATGANLLTKVEDLSTAKNKVNTLPAAYSNALSQQGKSQEAVNYLNALQDKNTVESQIGNADDRTAMSKLLNMSSTDQAKTYVFDSTTHEFREAQASDTGDRYTLSVDSSTSPTTYGLVKNGGASPLYPTNDEDALSKIKSYEANSTAVTNYQTAASTDADKNAVVAAGNNNLSDALTTYTAQLETDKTKAESIQTDLENQRKFLADNAVLDSSAITASMTPADKEAAADALLAKLTYFDSKYTKAADGTYTYTGTISDGAKKVDGTDATIKLNGVEFTSDTNTFNVNGLTIEAKGETSGEISITTQTDVDGIYEKIKDFLTSYNELINEMSTMYNAASSKGYEPLTSDEKYAMSDKEVEEWEKKIKSSILRRDDTLGGIMNSMTSAMRSTAEIGGKKYGLFSLGIKTASYFGASASERYALHIDGDSDDETSSGNADKLKAMLASDPDKAVEIFKQITTNLYEKLDKKMRSTSLRSAYTVYNDKEMAKSYSDYTKKIKKWDDKVANIEDSYYKKFAQMEKALAKLQSQTSSITGLFNN